MYLHLLPVSVLLLVSMLALPALSLEAPSLVNADSPTHSLLHFNSTLLNQDGVPLSGLHLITFSIRESKNGDSTPLWSETLLVPVDKDGNYTVNLGTTAPNFAEKVTDSHTLVYVTASSPAASANAAKAITTIPQGVFQICNPDGSIGQTNYDAACYGLSGETAETQLQTIANAGFTYVMNYSAFWGTQAQVQTYAAKANSLGLKLIWPFNDPDFAKYVGTNTGSKKGYLISDYSEISPNCGCTTNQGFITYLVNLVKGLPATAGYLTADEPANTSTVESNTHTLYNLINSQDSAHPQEITATWQDVNNPGLSYLQPYLDPFSFADILAGDYYPIGAGAPASDEAIAAADVATIAKTYGKKTSMSLQAFIWNQEGNSGVCSGTSGAYGCTFPTASQLQTMLGDVANDGGSPKYLLWFSYPDAAVSGNWSAFVTAVDPQH
jgi:hypothetical protein